MWTFAAWGLRKWVDRGFAAALVRHLAAGGVLLVAFCPSVWATPADNFGRVPLLTPICSMPGKALFMLRTTSNEGSHDLDVSRWFWATFDTRKRTWKIVPSAVHHTTLDPDAGKRVAIKGGMSFKAALRSMPSGVCGDPTARVGDEVGGPYAFRVSEGILTVVHSGLSQRVQRFRDADTFYIESLSNGRFARGCYDEFEHPSFRLFNLPTGHSVLEARDANQEHYCLFAVSNQKLGRAKARLLNRSGLRWHRRKDYHKAILHFSVARNADRSYAIAAFNEACARARLGQERDAVSLLNEIRSMKGLKAKIAAESDFDKMRNRPLLRQFMQKR